MFLDMNDLAGTKNAGGAAALAALMLAMPTTQRVGMANIQTPIFHLEDVNEETHSRSSGRRLRRKWLAMSEKRRRNLGLGEVVATF
ncbi:MAG: hypothetical protein NTV49_11190 [Kiritimatiellaeota bacterium]|nr:hypothetical protein [Kiritimatiellota bacterium]